MEKLLIFFLSLILLSSCEEEPKGILSEIKDWPMGARKELADSLYKKTRLYQGHTSRQALLDTLSIIDPTAEVYHRQKSITHTKIGDYHKAIPLLEKSYKLNPTESLYYYSWLSLFYYRDYPKALRLLTEYDELTPNVRDYAMGLNVNYLKGLCLKQMEQYREAIKQFDICIKEEKELVDHYAFVYRGICFKQLGQSKEAINSFNLALQKDANCTMAHYYKAIVYREINNEKKALSSMKKAQSLLNKGHKKIDSYVEVFDEIHPIMIDEFLKKG